MTQAQMAEVHQTPDAIYRSFAEREVFPEIMKMRLIFD
jgi:hypothetical protein